MKNVISEGDNYKRKDRIYRKAYIVLVQGDGFPSSAFSSKYKCWMEFVLKIRMHLKYVIWVYILHLTMGLEDSARSGAGKG